MGSRQFNKVGFRDVTPIMENQLEPEMKTGLTFERYDPPSVHPERSNLRHSHPSGIVKFGLP